MALLSFKCVNPNCSSYNEVVKKLVKGLQTELPVCDSCGESLKKVFNFYGNIKSETNSQSIGKVIQEKNESLKKKWESYSWEQKSVRQKVTEMINEKLKKE